MIIQYLINWDSLFFSGAVSPEQMTCQLTQLRVRIQRNGCLIRSGFAEAAWRRNSNRGQVLVDRAVSQFHSLYLEFGIDVDGCDKYSCNFSETIDNWEAYLKDSGFSLNEDDRRCVIVSKKPVERRDKSQIKFYKVSTIEDVLNDKDEGFIEKWSRLQCFDDSKHPEFLQYLEAFSVAGNGEIRIYDPYLVNVFRTSSDDSAWRASLEFLMGVFIRNQHVTKVDCITLFPEQGEKRGEKWRRDEKMFALLEYGEIVERLRKWLENRSDRVDISFHILGDPGDKDYGKNRRLFHDRFLVNGRYCFAIGHGFDICDRKKNNGDFCLSPFNVFYGGSKNVKEIQEHLQIFGERNPAKMFPKNLYALEFSKIRPWLVSKSNLSSSIDIGNNSRVTINPYVKP